MKRVPQGVNKQVLIPAQIDPSASPAPAAPRIKVTVTHSPDPARRALLEALMAEVRAEMAASATKAS